MFENSTGSDRRQRPIGKLSAIVWLIARSRTLQIDFAADENNVFISRSSWSESDGT